MAFTGSDIIAGLALLISAISLFLTWRFRSKVEKLIPLQEKVSSLWIEREETRTEKESMPRVGARLITHGTKTKVLRIFNGGKVAAHDVRVELPEDGHLVLSHDLESKFPMRRMEPGQKVDVLTSISMNTPLKHEIKLFWKDSGGQEFENDVIVTR